MMQWPDQQENNDTPPFIDSLNPSQKEAVLNTDGPIMIIAGAGSGKTRVLTYRIAYLMHKGIDPFNILSLTFTNKAAKEMQERIEKLVGAEARNLWMGTFHSVFARILRQEAEKIGYPSNFTIYDSDDSKSLIKTILKEMQIDDKLYKPNLVLSRISLSKNNLISSKAYANSAEYTDSDKAAGRPKFAEIFKQYTSRCFKAGAMDFDDILVNTHYLLSQFPDVLNKWQHRFKYILVDEYQDTNHVQYMITKLLAAVNQNICVVGDDAQSIYAFRGANIENILNYERDYPDVATFRLEQNYRSTQNIVKAASSLIQHNKKQLKKEIWTANDEGEKITVLRNPSDSDEGRKVAELIFEDQHKLHLPNRAFAILYRTNAQSRSMEEALRKRGIDYKIYGGVSFYQRKEVKDMLAYLRLIVNPHDEEALKRIINYPARGIGNTTITRLVYIANQNNIPIYDVVKNIRQYPEVGASVGKVEQFGILMDSFKQPDETKNAYEVAVDVAKRTGMLKTLYDDKSVEGISRYENITEFLNSVQEFTEDDESESEKTLPMFLENVALYTDDDRDKNADRDCISLMTIHASKGLEFPVVHIVGLEENLFPSQMALMNRQELEEERRLFYVAITRAEQKLYLSFATSRFRHGNLLHCEPSRFISEIDDAYLNMDLASMKQPGIMERQPRGERSISSREPLPKRKIYTTSKPVPPPPPVNPNFTPGDISALKTGDRVEHQRFGIGTVTDMEGQGDSRKAKVSFDNIGNKTLVLKFAKMRIV